MKRILITFAVMSTLALASCGSNETVHATTLDTSGIVVDSSAMDSAQVDSKDSAR